MVSYKLSNYFVSSRLHQQPWCLWAAAQRVEKASNLPGSRDPCVYPVVLSVLCWGRPESVFVRTAQPIFPYLPGGASVWTNIQSCCSPADQKFQLSSHCYSNNNVHSMHKLEGQCYKKFFQYFKLILTTSNPVKGPTALVHFPPSDTYSLALTWCRWSLTCDLSCSSIFFWRIISSKCWMDLATPGSIFTRSWELTDISCRNIHL